MVIDNGDEAGSQAEVSETPGLPEDFYKALLDLPSCIANGYCDNCGRCEH